MEIHKIGIYINQPLPFNLKKNEIVYDVVFIFNNLCIPKKYFLV